MKPLDRFTCEETFRRLEDYVDRQLTPEELRLVEAHLRECVMCADEFKFEAGVLCDVRSKLGRIQVPASLRQRIAQMLENERRGESFGHTCEPGNQSG